MARDGLHREDLNREGLSKESESKWSEHWGFEAGAVSHPRGTATALGGDLQASAPQGGAKSRVERCSGAAHYRFEPSGVAKFF